jgi:hypothetical protein
MGNGVGHSFVDAGRMHGFFAHMHLSNLTPSLLVAAVALPATSKAELIVNSTREETAAIPGAIYTSFSAFQYTSGGYLLRLGQINIQNDFWHLNSVKFDGITVLGPAYTPNTADFNLVIAGGPGLNVISGNAAASAVGSLVDSGNGTSRFDITFNDISGQNSFGYDALGAFGGGSFVFYLGLATGTALQDWQVVVDGYLPTQSVQWQGRPSQVFLGEVPSVSWIGPASMVIDATSLFGPPPPIPEPSTYGLILGGLALAGAAIRRRKSAK